MNIKYHNTFATYDYIHMCIIGNTLFVNAIKNNKVKITYRFDIMDLIFKKEENFFPTLFSHWKEENLLITINDLKYLRKVKIL